MYVSRGSRRARVRLPVTARIGADGASAFICRTRDISELGLLLETPELVPPGTEIFLTLLDDQTGEAIELEGEVARSVPAEGATPAALGVSLTRGAPAWSALV